MGFPHVSRAVGVDSRVLYPAAVYHGGMLLATSGGAATVAVYDGLKNAACPAATQAPAKVMRDLSSAAETARSTATGTP